MSDNLPHFILVITSMNYNESRSKWWRLNVFNPHVTLTLLIMLFQAIRKNSNLYKLNCVRQKVLSFSEWYDKIRITLPYDNVEYNCFN